MDEKQIAEVEFWRDLYRQLGLSGFLDLRRKDRERIFSHFPELAAEDGLGLDYGCGCWSMYEGSGKNVDAYDPLLNEYNRILDSDLSREVGYIYDLSAIPTDFYDWVACVNVADHTPTRPPSSGTSTRS